MKPNLHLSLCSIIFTSLSILQQIPRCFSQDNQLYKTCGHPFQCGTIGEIRYPFWGDERPPSCGYPGFELSCQEDVPRLSTTSLSYQILEIDNSARTLRVSRDDLQSSNLCPRLLHDTTLNFTLFDFYSSAGDQNITLYYGCTLNQPLPPNLLTRQFYCFVNNTNSSSFFHYPTPEAPSIGNGITCKSHISVPVNRTAAQEILATSSIAHVESAVKSGFWIQWSADNVNCRNCMQSGGLCGQNPDSGSFACHCTDRSYTLTCNDTRTGNGNGSRKGHSDRQKHVIIGMTLGVAGILLSSLIIFYITKQCRLHKLDRRSNQKVDEFLLNNGSPAPKRYS